MVRKKAGAERSTEFRSFKKRQSLEVSRNEMVPTNIKHWKIRREKKLFEKYIGLAQPSRRVSPAQATGPLPPAPSLAASVGPSVPTTAEPTVARACDPPLSSPLLSRGPSPQP